MNTRAGVYLTTVAVLAGLATHGTYAGSGDEPHYLAIAHSIAFDHDLDLSNNYGAAEPLIGGGQLHPEMHAQPGRGGILRPAHDIGMPLLFAPYIRVARPISAAIAADMEPSLMARLHLTPSVLYRQTISAAMIALAGVLTLVFFDVCLRIGMSERRAVWTTLLMALSPPLLIFSILFFTEMVSALLVLAIFRLIVVVQGPSRTWEWGAAGLATGFLVLVHTRNVMLAATLGALAIWTLLQRGEHRRLILFGSAAMAMLAIRTFVIHEFWGTWITTPLAKVGEWPGAMRFLSIVAGRSAGLAIDQEYGLLLTAPVFVVGVFGAVALARTRPRVMSGIAIVAGGYVTSLVLPLTNPVGWTGGWSPAARFLVPIVPLVAIAVAAGLRAAPRSIVTLLLVAQVGIDAYVWQHPKIVWSNGRGEAAVCDRLAVNICAFLPSFIKTP